MTDALSTQHPGMCPQVNTSDTRAEGSGHSGCTSADPGHPLSFKKQRWPYELSQRPLGALTVRPEGHWILSGHLSFLKAQGAGQPTFLGSCDWAEQGHLW